MGDEIPAAIIQMYPYVDSEVWVRLSEHRYRAPHPNDTYAILVVSLFGETVARGVRADPGDERAAFADLISSAATSAAHRTACAEGTPIVRPNTAANEGVVGRCWWCGSLPEQHGHAEATDG